MSRVSPAGTATRGESFGKMGGRVSMRRAVVFTGLLGLLVVVAVLLATQSWSPLSAASGNSEPSPVWSGQISLMPGSHYAMDSLPLQPLEACTGCMAIVRGPGGGVSLEAENGVFAVPQKGEPSYAKCVLWRHSGYQQDSVALPGSGQGGIPVNGWLCATSKEDHILRLQYLGGNSGGGYRFAVTAWLRPTLNGYNEE